MSNSSDNHTVADARPGNWVDRHAPPALRPYAQLARFDRPIGWWLLMWPCWWSAALVAGATGAPWPNPWHLALFMIGSIVMRGAGCTWNDITDRDIDAKVERTRSRPIPAGRVGVRQAVAFMVFLGLVGLLVLVQFNAFTIVLGIASLLVVVVYPFMKRLTGHPQIVLGLAFSWGALVGWSATTGSLEVAPLVFFIGCVFWVVGYDTIYAHQDREDDALIGLGSTALTYGEKTKPFLAGCFMATLLLFVIAFVAAGAGLIAFVGLAGFALQLAWQVTRLDINDGALCLRIFKSNSKAGWILFVGLTADTLLRSAIQTF
ncbi:4-hydroxybenzoate octaprenyltransferase [Hartmannibacter diazotrophicus]|uniref:4-hydroxybenzoate octaprenyltransferase n=1 Tax=Hartmannibacter diazotrophicus TaxID=1482074 RepID=A0A2C9D373_9HYPH|nr:4-hydroxybenzoate octaprenyltransferase [Hartmannibacter diazotrophicus]SON54639.1 4-hydroxybenzoate octaprenyltransferase [Hartmannibacter diazotrophicus]